jgi:hypothetical protein
VSPHGADMASIAMPRGDTTSFLQYMCVISRATIQVGRRVACGWVKAGSGEEGDMCGVEANRGQHVQGQSLQWRSGKSAIASLLPVDEKMISHTTKQWRLTPTKGVGAIGVTNKMVGVTAEWGWREG